jgi:hypothetical protein
MRPTALLAAAVLLASSLLAGCSGTASAPPEVIVESKPVEEVHSNETLPAVFTPSPKTRGHIAGVVVDEAIRPIQGARVRLPGLDLARTTDRDGSFGFVDLHPGPYFITVEATGFYAAEAVLEVSAEEFTRAKVILTRVPPPEPYKVTQSFEGYADVSDGELVLIWANGLFCGSCQFDFYLDRPGLHTVVMEAAIESPANGDGLDHRLYGLNGTQRVLMSYGESGTPMRLELRDADLGSGDRFELGVYPTSFPAPQMSKRFQVFVTAFYNEGPPTGWSLVAGDP